VRALLWSCVLLGVAFGLWRLLPHAVERTAPKDAAEEPTIGGRPFSQFLLRHDKFLAATDPATVPAAEATWLRPGDEVFGVVLRGVARAYPISMLAYHHVVNDVIAGIPVAVTY